MAVPRSLALGRHSDLNTSALYIECRLLTGIDGPRYFPSKFQGLLTRSFCEMIYYFYTLSRETWCLFHFTVSPEERRTRYLLNVNRADEQSMVNHERYGEHHASLQEGERYELKQKEIRARTFNKTVDICEMFIVICTNAFPTEWLHNVISRNLSSLLHNMMYNLTCARICLACLKLLTQALVIKNINLYLLQN